MVTVTEVDDIEICYAQGATIEPKIPHVEKVGKLSFGDIVIIRGKVPISSKGFSVNLKPVDGIALHVNARYPPPPTPRFTVLNTLLPEGGGWGNEIRLGPHNTVKLGAIFSIGILVQTTHYKLACNEDHVTTYDHVLPVGDVSWVTVEGDVAVVSCQVQRLSERVSLTSPPEKNTPNVIPPLQWYWFEVRHRQD